MWKFVPNREQVAAWLTALGAGRSRPFWQLIYAFSPAVTGMVSTLTEASRPENQVVWWFAEETSAEVIEGILDEVSELIVRAPTPLGLDSYCVFISALGKLPDDPLPMTAERADETLDARPAVAARVVEGKRWRDWKHGHGRAAVRKTLEQLAPQPGAPVTLIQVAVIGSGVAHSLRAFGAL